MNQDYVNSIVKIQTIHDNVMSAIKDATSLYEYNKEQYGYISKYVACVDLLDALRNIEFADLSDSRISNINYGKPYCNTINPNDVDSVKLKCSIANIAKEVNEVLMDLNVDDLTSQYGIINKLYDMIIETITLSDNFIVLLYPDDRIIEALVKNIIKHPSKLTHVFYDNLKKDNRSINTAHITLPLLAKYMLEYYDSLIDVFGKTSFNKDQIRPIVTFIMENHNDEDRFLLFIRSMYRYGFIQYCYNLKDMMIQFGRLHLNNDREDCICNITMLWYLLIISEIENIALESEQMKSLRVLVLRGDKDKFETSKFKNKCDKCNRLISNHINNIGRYKIRDIFK